MICEICHGEGSLATLFGETRPCPECNGSGVASCCDTAGAHYVASYRDDAFEPRKCDYCGQEYRGPAVYCSLECATDDI